ncbi:MAG: DUF4292 domain-containing protein [Deltaproteobacteria bacterium]|nr:DUF4292 domain-containing protein [Deltaproteobacteria bacterium]
MVSCSVTPALKREPRNRPKEIFKNAAQVAKKYIINSFTQKALIGSGQATVTQDNKPYHFDFSVAARHPTLSRFEAMTQFGQTLGILITNIHKASYYNPQDSKLYENEDLIPHVSSYIPYDLHKKDFVGLLLNYVALPHLLKGTTFQFNEKFNVYEFAYQNQGQKWHVFIDPFDFYLSDVFMYDENDSLLLKISYYQFERLPSGRLFPKSLLLESYGKDPAMWTLRMGDVSFQKHYSPKLFQLEVPIFSYDKLENK